MDIELIEQNLESLNRLIVYTKQKYQDHIAKLEKQKEVYENELGKYKSGNRGDKRGLNADVTSDRRIK